MVGQINLKKLGATVGEDGRHYVKFEGKEYPVSGAGSWTGLNELRDAQAKAAQRDAGKVRSPTSTQGTQNSLSVEGRAARLQQQEVTDSKNRLNQATALDTRGATTAARGGVGRPGEKVTAEGRQERSDEIRGLQSKVRQTHATTLSSKKPFGGPS